MYYSPFRLFGSVAAPRVVLLDAISDRRFVCSVQSSLACRVAIPVERLVVGRDHHALGVEVVVETLGAELAADAGVVDAAPGRGRVEPVMIVDPDDAGLDGGGHAMRAADVAGADGGGQPERRIVGEPKASASSLNGVTEVKGPNTSSWKMRMSDVTSANTVGSTKKPLSWPGTFAATPPVTSRAPSSRPNRE